MQVNDFLACETPGAWVEVALDQPMLLLVDHAHCEKKAASTALSFIFRYPDRPDLMQKMSRFAREELRHFEKVLSLIVKKGGRFNYLSPSRYAGELRSHVRTTEPYKLIDTLIIGAFIEARSCERFAKLVPVLEEDIATFYRGLLAAEARHFQTYLELAKQAADHDIQERVNEFATIEAELVMRPDDQFRFQLDSMRKCTTS